MAKAPSFPFYPGDWMKDGKLGICSTFARGLLADVMCLSFECEITGLFSVNGHSMTVQQIAGFCRGSEPNKAEGIEELISNGVLKTFDPANPLDNDVEAFLSQVVTLSGPCFYHKRHVKYGMLHDARSASGSAGGKSTQSSKRSSKSEASDKAKHKANIESPVEQNIEQNQASSSSSSSSLSSLEDKTKTAGDFKLANECDDSETPEKHRCPLPKDFCVSESMGRWFDGQRPKFTFDIVRETEAFMDDARKKGTQWINWVAAWRNWMRNAQQYQNERNQRNQARGVNERSRTIVHRPEPKSNDHGKDARFVTGIPGRTQGTL